MPTVFSHAVAAVGLGTLFRAPGPPARFWLAGAGCAMAPDLDVLGLSFGIPFGHVLGHRGFTHSFPFAAALAAGLTWMLFGDPQWRRRRTWLWLYLFLAPASHGVLDAMTDGGLGVAFWAPFEERRYFLPWRPIPVSPIALSRFLGPRGAHVMQAELLWIWLPAAVLAAAGIAWHWRARQ
jgi:inner membrane protein